MKFLSKLLMIALFLGAAVLLIMANMAELPDATRLTARYAGFALLLAMAGVLLIGEQCNKKRRTAILKALAAHDDLSAGLSVKASEDGIQTCELYPGVLLVAGKGRMSIKPDPKGIHWIVIAPGIETLGKGVIPDTVAELFIPDTVTTIENGAICGQQTILRVFKNTAAAEYARTHGLQAELLDPAAV